MDLWLIVILFTVILSLVVTVIAENRHPVKTLAWILVLILLPVLGLILYFLFGINKKKDRLVNDEQLDSFKQHTLNNYIDSIVNIENETSKLLQMTNKAIPLGGNEVTVFTDFNSMFASLAEDMRNAKNHINFQFFKIEDDPIGRALAEIMAERASKGVDVKVLYDDAANLIRKPFYRRMKKKGIQVQPFLKVIIPFLSSNTNYRNHRKVVVIDGNIAYCGGMNIAERYSVGIRGGNWRDTHFRVRGPAASELQTSFLVDWLFTSKRSIKDVEMYYPAYKPEGNVQMQIATSGVMDEWHVTMQGMISLISQAKKYVYLESPYFIPTETFMMALRNAALSGVDVRIIIPYRGDRGALTPLATRSYVESALIAGVKVFFYNGGYMHSKTIVVDDQVSTIGSTNIDVRSFEQDFEVNGFFYNEEVATTLRKAFLKDSENSTQVFLEEWQQRPQIEKLNESFARLFSMLL
ncbi:MAG: cardiolipin synthase [Bacteroidales bacterium]|nr:cardiolipin synthase [Bacteroidales bacterium]